MQRTREQPCMSGEDDVKKCISQCKTYLMAFQNSYWEKLLYNVWSTVGLLIACTNFITRSAKPILTCD